MFTRINWCLNDYKQVPKYRIYASNGTGVRSLFEPFFSFWGFGPRGAITPTGAIHKYAIIKLSSQACFFHRTPVP